jgi:hypothetical protein
MTTKLDRLLEKIDPSRTLNAVSSRVDDAVNSFPMTEGAITGWDRFEQVLSKFARHVENKVLHIRADFPPSVYDLVRCEKLLEKEYGDQGRKVAFEMASTGVQGGLYEVLKKIASHLAHDYAQNQISALVDRFWNDLSMNERFAVMDEYAEKFGQFLPKSYLEGSRVFLKINSIKVLEEHPRMIQRLRELKRI